MTPRLGAGDSLVIFAGGYVSLPNCKYIIRARATSLAGNNGRVRVGGAIVRCVARANVSVGGWT